MDDLDFSEMYPTPTLAHLECAVSALATETHRIATRRALHCRRSSGYIVFTASFPGTPGYIGVSFSDDTLTGKQEFASGPIPFDTLTKDQMRQRIHDATRSIPILTFD